MLTRFANRLFWSLVTLLGTAVLTFLLINLVPGDVARVIAGDKVPGHLWALPDSPSSSPYWPSTSWARGCKK